MQKIDQQTQVVVGLGKSGLSLVRFLARQEQAFAVADSRENPPELLLCNAITQRWLCTAGRYRQNC